MMLSVPQPVYSQGGIVISCHQKPNQLASLTRLQVPGNLTFHFPLHFHQFSNHTTPFPSSYHIIDWYHSKYCIQIHHSHHHCHMPDQVPHQTWLYTTANPHCTNDVQNMFEHPSQGHRLA